MVLCVAFKAFAKPLARAFAFAAIFILEVVLADNGQNLLLGALFPARIRPIRFVLPYFLSFGGVGCSENCCAASRQLASARLVDEPIHSFHFNVFTLGKPVLTVCAQEFAKLFRTHIDKAHAAIGLGKQVSGGLHENADVVFPCSNGSLEASSRYGNLRRVGLQAHIVDMLVPK